jgi:LPXTG-site transpeptidase (sortase) family protein
VPEVLAHYPALLTNINKFSIILDLRYLSRISIMLFKTQSNTPIKNYAWLFFILAIVGGISLLFGPAPIEFLAVEVEKPISSQLPEVRTIPTIAEVLAARLIIPKINVDAVIQDMGLTSEGAMAVPNNRVDVGWYSLGTRPGETGSAVIGGHNRWHGGVAVFDPLHQLEKGDVLSVVNAKGVSISFVVRDMRTYNATDANTGIFESKSGAHLNLITCSGVWDPTTNSYTTRLVIFTDVVQTANKIVAAPI